MGEDSGVFSSKTGKEYQSQTSDTTYLSLTQWTHFLRVCVCVFIMCVSTCEGVCLWLNARLFIRWSEAGVKTMIGPNWSWCW